MSSPDKPVLKVDFCSHEAAKYAVENWHYSGVLPTPPIVKVGAWEGGKYIGCVLFSRGANNNIGKPFGLECTGVAELTRVALTKHEAPVSKVLSIAMRLLRKNSDGLRLLVSYADPKQGHHGGIYQATGWVYVGKSPTSVEFIAPDGKQWHGRMVSSTGRTRVYGQSRNVWRHDQCVKVEVKGKHKYLYPLDAEMNSRVEPLRKPYPKRAGSSSVEHHVSNGEVGGSIPTPALQSITDQ